MSISWTVNNLFLLAITKFKFSLVLKERVEREDIMLFLVIRPGRLSSACRFNAPVDLGTDLGLESTLLSTSYRR